MLWRASLQTRQHVRMLEGAVGVVNLQMADQSLSASFSELLATARGHFTWPEDAILYCLPTDRELLPDKVRRLCFQTYLQLCKLSYDTRTASNADAMSPNGLAPFLMVRICGHTTIFSEFEKLVLFLEAQSLGLDSGLQPMEKADNAAFVSAIRTKMAPVEAHQTWICTSNSNEHSIKTYGLGLAWPLRQLLPWLHRIDFIWNNWSLYRAKEDDILLEYEAVCSALQARLGERDTFFDAGPSSLDVLVFSHVQAVLATPLPSNKLCDIARQHRNLIQFCQTLATKHSLI